MFKNQDVAKKQIKAYLNKLEQMSNISQQQIDAFKTMISNISEQKRIKLLERAAKIDKRLVNQQSLILTTTENENKDQIDEKSSQQDFNFNFQQEEVRSFKTMYLNKGSQYTVTSFQNTVLSLIIDGFISEIKTNNKRFYSPIYTNGNAGTAVINLNCNAFTPEMQQQIVDKGGNVLQQAAQFAQKVQKNKEVKNSLFQSNFVTVAHSFYQQVLHPFNSQPKCEISSLFITDEQRIQNKFQMCQQMKHGKHIKIIALDCEMVQTGSTNHDLSLARLSIVDEQGKIVLDEYSLPNKPIIDYLTEYSGITVQQLENAQSETQLQNKFKQLINEMNNEYNVVICGHGLENDLQVLDFNYDQIIDTSILFANGIFKQKLKFLTQKYLKYQIQQGRQGHSSVQDAQAVMQLVLGVLKGLNCKDIQIDEDINQIKLYKQIKLIDRIEMCKQQAIYQFKINQYEDEQFFQSKELIQNSDVRQLNLVNLTQVDDIQQCIDRILDVLPNRTIILFILQAKDNQDVNLVNYIIKQ